MPAGVLVLATLAGLLLLASVALALPRRGRSHRTSWPGAPRLGALAVLAYHPARCRHRSAPLEPTIDPQGQRQRNVLGGLLQVCGTDPLTGFWRDGCCTAGPQDPGMHTVCAVVTTEFLEHQYRTGNDLVTPMPHFRFPGLKPGDRWCVVAPRWLQAYQDGAAAPVVLEATNASVLELIPLEVLQEHAVDVPSDLSGLDS